MRFNYKFLIGADETELTQFGLVPYTNEYTMLHCTSIDKEQKRNDCRQMKFVREAMTVAQISKDVQVVLKISMSS